MHWGGWVCFICVVNLFARYCMSTARPDDCLELMNIQLWAALSTRLSWDTVHGSIICWNKLVCWRKNVLKDFRCLGKELAKSAIQFPSWGNPSSNTGFQNKTWQSWSLPHSVSQSAFVAFPFLKLWGCVVFSMQCWEHRTLCQWAPLLLVIFKSPQKLPLSSVANASCLWKQFQFIFYKGK